MVAHNWTINLIVLIIPIKILNLIRTNWIQLKQMEYNSILFVGFSLKLSDALQVLKYHFLELIKTFDLKDVWRRQFSSLKSLRTVANL